MRAAEGRPEPARGGVVRIGPLRVGPVRPGPVFIGPVFIGPVFVDPVFVDPVFVGFVLVSPVLANPVLDKPVLDKPVRLVAPRVDTSVRAPDLLADLPAARKELKYSLRPASVRASVRAPVLAPEGRPSLRTDPDPVPARARGHTPAFFADALARGFGLEGLDNFAGARLAIRGFSTPRRADLSPVRTAAVLAGACSWTLSATSSTGDKLRHAPGFKCPSVILSMRTRLSLSTR